ncbi:TPA: type I toxin-antitoxin system toxin Ldr family protein [Kluyvera georgiana]|nr:type I toxin-antitoxin system toxin Ldr family protein [Kluyvera georgiana]HED1419785.1 type I toxin-antitoxin system toxin Ldr family protein [Kluyvera georgiana]
MNENSDACSQLKRHDLAAPVIAGVLVSLIVSHWRSRK